ncbi:MAG: tyrosine-type recombinase/integrase, partial [Chloroflexi bacterium]|nr:tyrosine-type recombinase/integrase [Chloroflexota bacterium]
MISSLSEAAATYRIVAQAEGKSPRTIEWVEGSVRYLKEFLGDDPPPQELTRHDLRRFIAALRERPKWAEHPFNRPKGRISPTSINNYVRGIKLLFSALEREGLLPPHEITTMKAPKIPKKVIVPFTESQIRDVFKALQNGRAPLRDRAMTWLMLDPGLRVSELINLSDEDVELNERQVRVMGKGEKERVLPLGAWVTKALLTYKVKA